MGIRRRGDVISEYSIIDNCIVNLGHRQGTGCMVSEIMGKNKNCKLCEKIYVVLLEPWFHSGTKVG